MVNACKQERGGDDIATGQTPALLILPAWQGHNDHDRSLNSCPCDNISATFCVHSALVPTYNFQFPAQQQTKQIEAAAFLEKLFLEARRVQETKDPRTMQLMHLDFLIQQETVLEPFIVHFM